MMMKKLNAFIITAFLAMWGCNQQTLIPLTSIPTAPPPQTITIQITGYTPPAGRIFKNIFVSNFSVVPQEATLNLSTARDGMTDVMKESLTADYGMGISGPYTANAYFSDLMLYLAGITSTQQSYLYCAASQTGNTSKDALLYTDARTGNQTYLGLRDCEKSYLGLDTSKFDNDGDGVPDYLELRCGMNPLNANDANISASGDSVTNLEKCKRHIPLDENANSQPNTLFAYNYDQRLLADGSTTFTVSNIPILNNGADNFLAYYIIEQDSASLATYIYTAYSVLNAGSQSKIYTFAFWGSNPINANNQEILLP